MSKRDFLRQSGSVGAALILGHKSGVAATLSIQAGSEYLLIQPAQATQVIDGQIEVVEFFWYACPHCYALEPLIEQWTKNLPSDVHFRRVHVAFRFPVHQQIHYTLTELGEDRRLGMKVFEAIHRGRMRMRNLTEILDWADSQGVDPKRFSQVFESDQVRNKMREASATVDSFGIKSVPRLAVHGTYLTSPVMAGSNEAALQVVDALIDRVRRAR